MRTTHNTILATMGRRLGRPVSVRGDAQRTRRIASQAIRERMGEIHDQATALANLAENENRDLSEEETAQFDRLMGDYNRIRDEDLPRAEWLEEEQARLAEQRIAAREAAGDTSGQAGRPLRGPESPEAIAGETGIRAARIRVPQRALAYAGTLRNFHGEYAVERAYLSGQWLLATLFNSAKARKWCQDNGIEIRAALAGADNTLGGALVPDEFVASLIVLQEQYGTFRRKARRWPMASDRTIIPRLISGVTVYFPGENQEITESNVKFDNVALTARKMAALVKWPTELDEDSAIQLADLLAQQIAYAMAVKEDQCGFIGDGTSTYAGMVGLVTACTAATATIVTAAAGNTSFGTLDLADLEAMVGLLPEYPGIAPEWYISKAGWAASMMRLADAAGGVTAAEIEGQRRLSFLGYPVNIVQCLNKTLTAQTSTKGLCFFGDLGMAATMGTRRGFAVETTRERYFELDQLAIKGTERIDINVHDVGDTSHAGAVVMLATPAT